MFLSVCCESTAFDVYSQQDRTLSILLCDRGVIVHGGGWGYNVLKLERKVSIGVAEIGSDLTLDMGMGCTDGVLS